MAERTSLLTVVRNIYHLPELRQKLLFTAGMLLMFRVLAHLPAVNLEQTQLNEILADNVLVGFIDLFAGGKVLTNFSVVAAGTLPYILATTIVHFLIPLIPALDALRDEGEAGEEKLKRYQYGTTAVTSLALAWVLSKFLQRPIGLFPNDASLLNPATLLRSLALITTFTAGGLLTTWLTIQIDKKGIGGGTTMLLSVGLCGALSEHSIHMIANRHIWIKPWALTITVITVVPILTVLAMIILLESKRPIPVHYGKRIRGINKFAGGSSYVPLYLQPAGIQPILFTQGWLTLLGLLGIALSTSPTSPWLQALGAGLIAAVYPLGYPYWGLLFVGVLFFSIILGEALFQQENLAGVLQRQGGFVPGVRPGLKTHEFLTKISRRITWVGGLCLASIITFLPNLYYYFTGQDGYFVVLAFLLLTGIVRDLARQVEAQLLMRHYEGFIPSHTPRSS